MKKFGFVIFVVLFWGQVTGASAAEEQLWCGEVQEENVTPETEVTGHGPCGYLFGEDKDVCCESYRDDQWNQCLQDYQSVAQDACMQQCIDSLLIYCFNSTPDVFYCVYYLMGSCPYSEGYQFCMYYHMNSMIPNCGDYAYDSYNYCISN